MKNNLFFAFSSKPFVFLWMAEVFTQIPVNLLNFLLILVVYNLTQSNTAVSGIVLSFTLPAVFFGILAGIYIDRWNKKSVLLVTNISRAILFVLLAIFHQNVTVVYILSFLITVITQFFIPAESPIIPLLVKEKQLLSANALFGIGIFGSILIAYLLSGAMLLSLGIVNTLLVLAFMLLIGGVFIYLIQVPESETNKGFNLRHLGIPVGAVWNEIKTVLGVIHSSRQIASSLFLLAMSQILILIVAAVAPGYATEVLKIQVEQFPLVVITPATIGIIFGAFLIANIFHTAKKDMLVTIGLLLSSFVMTAMPFGSALASKSFVHLFNSYLPSFLRITNIDIIVFLSFLLGIANSFVFIPSNTILQEKTSDEIRGKIYGVLNTLVGILSFLPILLVGSFSDLVGVGKVMMGIGISLFLLALGKMMIK